MIQLSKSVVETVSIVEIPRLIDSSNSNISNIEQKLIPCKISTSIFIGSFVLLICKVILVCFWIG